ncbi:MFS transporter [Qipengyuania sp. MTN3-11]|uniref:MFS transporter n=1 Tax=Qipengyuania sp. MTN3-11 TaxID=3056557 RepID=UPI0036F3032D
MSFVSGPLPQRLKIVHGFGAVAFGVKDSGFSFFLLIFYNQVLGMNAGLVSLALACALLVDAVVDPILGNLSDRTYTRWGRRLPWLYAAALPLALAWAVLWNPAVDGTPSFWELLGIAIVVRILLSACEVPSVSLLPEITADYDERTTLFRYRYLFGWIGGLTMMLLAYTVFMRGPEGMLDASGYSPFGIFGAVLIFVSVVGSAIGQHRLVAHLPADRPPPFTIRQAFSEIREAFSERAFLIFAAGAMAAYVSQGMTFSISNYVNLFVWQFDRTALVIYPIILFLSVVLMFFVVGPLHRRFGKPRSAALSMIVALGLGMLPYALFVGGLWPEPGTAASTALFYGFLLLSNTSGIVTMISGSSMIAEIVEAFQERTGRRAEGSFYSGNWFVQKCATGVGIFLTGQIIAFSGLPTDAAQGSVDDDVLIRLIVLYALASAVLASVAAYWLGRFPITREEHEARIAALDLAARGDIDAGTTGP